MQEGGFPAGVFWEAAVSPITLCLQRYEDCVRGRTHFCFTCPGSAISCQCLFPLTCCGLKLWIQIWTWFESSPKSCIWQIFTYSLVHNVQTEMGRTRFAVPAAATWSRPQKYYILRNFISLAKLETVANVRENNSVAHLYSAALPELLQSLSCEICFHPLWNLSCKINKIHLTDLLI